MMENKMIKQVVLVIAVVLIFPAMVFAVSGKETVQTISEARLRSLFLEYITSHAQGADIQLRRFNVRGDTQFPPGDVVLKIVKTHRGSISGRISLTVAVRIDGETEGRIFLSGWADRYEPVVCAARRLSRGTTLGKSDVQLQKMNVSKAPSNIVMHLDDALGKRLKNSLSAGEYLRNNMVENLPLVQKGDTVSLVAKNGYVTVTTMGIAKSDGARDEQIRVENTDSERVVIGRVVGERQVEVLF